MARSDVAPTLFYRALLGKFETNCRATVKVALLDVVRRPKGRAHWKRGDKRLRIITGMGNNSKDNEAVIKVGQGFGCRWS